MTAILPIGGPEPAAVEFAPESTSAVAYLPARTLTGPAPWFGTRHRLLPIADVLAALVATAAFAPRGVAPAGVPGLVAVALAGLWVCLLASTRAYELRPVGFGIEDARRVARAGAALTIAWLLVGSVGTAQADPLRLVAVAATATTLAVGARWAMSASAGTTRHRTAAARIVVAGHRRDVGPLLAELRSSGAPLSVVAVCLAGRARPVGFDVPVSAGLRSLPDCVERHRADAVIVAPGRHVDPPRLRRLAWELEAGGTQLMVATGLLDVSHGRASLGHAGSLPLLHVRHAELKGARRLLKALWERLAAGLALLLLAPLLLGLAIVVRLESEGPALFRQNRVGKDGTTFTMLKFRTMCADAEVRRAALCAPEAHHGVLFKLENDPRVTRVGQLLRRFSLDELPQLINVVRGEMALVGPRPALPAEVEQYDVDTRRRLAVTPGLTGLWQVSGRSDLSWEESVRLDLRYVENWSIGLDLRILCRTVQAVIGHRGAY